MELDFTNDVLEKLLFKKALVDKKWMNILSKTYDKRWFKVPHIGMLLGVVLKYYDKYNSIPNNQVIISLAKKYEEIHHEDIQLSEVSELMMEI